MNVKKSNLFWGFLLIVGGAFALAQQLGYVDQLSPQVAMYFFAAIGLFALVMYAISGWKEWGWLFPFGIFGGLAITAAMTTSRVDDSSPGAPLFFGLLIPFVAAYLTDRIHNWWALIPGGAMLFLALTTLLVDSAGGEWVGAMFLFLLALSFLAVYLNDRTRTWAALVAYILAALSIAPAMASGGGETASYYGSIFMLAVALPFYFIYFRNSQQYWWAIIPAGVTTVLSIIAALAIGGLIREADEGGFANAILMFGLAATFAVVWLRHNKAWAKIVSIVLAIVGVVSLFFASFTETFWPIAIILVGAYMLYVAFRTKKA